MWKVRRTREKFVNLKQQNVLYVNRVINDRLLLIRTAIVFLLNNIIFHINPQTYDLHLDHHCTEASHIDIFILAVWRKFVTMDLVKRSSVPRVSYISVSIRSTNGKVVGWIPIRSSRSSFFFANVIHWITQSSYMKHYPIEAFIRSKSNQVIQAPVVRRLDNAS